MKTENYQVLIIATVLVAIAIPATLLTYKPPQITAHQTMPQVYDVYPTNTAIRGANGFRVAPEKQGKGEEYTRMPAGYKTVCDSSGRYAIQTDNGTVAFMFAFTNRADAPSNAWAIKWILDVAKAEREREAAQPPLWKECENP